MVGNYRVRLFRAITVNTAPDKALSTKMYVVGTH